MEEAPCRGENCSCTVSDHSMVAGDKRCFGFLADEELLLFADSLATKKRAAEPIDRSSRNANVSYDIGSSLSLHSDAPSLHSAPHETSSLSRTSADSNETWPSSAQEESFKESFYSSGTDWSRLYIVDEYGMPCDGLHDCCTAIVSGSNYAKETVHTAEDDCSTDRRLFEQKTGLRHGKSLLLKKSTAGMHGTLVQSTLPTCWGFKHSSSTSQSITFNDVTKPASSFWAKFQISAAPVPVKAQLAVARRQSNRNTSDFKERRCPFYKKIPGTNFTVDAFRYGAVDGCRAYFLTHFHCDHYGGLTKSWSHGRIYCTPITARLLSLCLYVDSSWIFPMQIGATFVVDGVEVKFLEANHCPGAAIILFRLKSGQSILHTGDFRACKEMQTYLDLKDSRISTVYLDTTYCNPRYRFPLQKEVIDFVIQVTQATLKRNKQTLVVVGAYSIGKERVYLGIAEALNVSIFVDSRRSRILKALEWPELVRCLSKDAGNSMLHVLPIGHLQPQKLKAYLKGHPQFTAVLAFRPTGWTYSERIGDQLHLLKPVVNGPVTVYGVPYSEHSSFTELRDFVQFLRPDNIISTVNVGRKEERERMQSYFRQWLCNTSGSVR